LKRNECRALTSVFFSNQTRNKEDTATNR